MVIIRPGVSPLDPTKGGALGTLPGCGSGAAGPSGSRAEPWPCFNTIVSPQALTVIDAPPHAAPAASQIAKRADLVLIPVRPAAFDLAAVPAAVEIVRAAKVQGAFVLSACPFRAPEIGDTRGAEALRLAGLPRKDHRPARLRQLADAEGTTIQAYGRSRAISRAGATWIATDRASHTLIRRYVYS